MQSQTNDGPQYPLPSKLIHDLRNPLNLIIGYSELLIEMAKESERADFVADLKTVHSAGKDLLAIICKQLVPEKSHETLELFEAAVPGTSDASPQAFASGVAQGLLLVVDDNESNRDVLSRRLVRQGYMVVTADNGRAALQMMRDRVFDLVLLDIMMPEMDGYEVLERIMADEILHHIPVIMISALNEHSAVVRCIELGAADHLTKPFDSPLLIARVGACLEKKRGHDRETALFDELNQSHQRLRELERQRDDLANMIVHDLRTPLTSLIAGMQSLESMGELNKLQKEMVAISLNGSETLLSMISDLLDVEKLEAGSMKLIYSKLSASSLVDSALRQVTSLALSRELLLEHEVPLDLPLFDGDEGTLRRTLVNLLGNSIKFTPVGGTLTLSVALEDDGQALVFSLRDTGEGIPEEAFGRIFEKFGQVESRQGGRKLSTGLGLTFCKLAVGAHGGAISVKSTVGDGSTFSFTIPLRSPSLACK